MAEYKELTRPGGDEREIGTSVQPDSGTRGITEAAVPAVDKSGSPEAEAHKGEMSGLPEAEMIAGEISGLPEAEATAEEMAGSSETKGTDSVGGTGTAGMSENEASAIGTAPVRRRSPLLRLLLCCLSFVIVSGLATAVFYAVGAEPFGTNAVTIDDAKIQYIDFFTYYVDVLRGVRSLSYDFANTLGGNTVGVFGYYLASPFNLLLYFMGKEGVYRFFDIAVILKLGTAAATFAWFLQRRFEDRIRPVFVLVLSMGYGLMQYSVQQSSNIMWLDGVYMMPLIMLGVYEVIHRKSVWRLSLAVALSIYFNWYIAGVTCLFSGIWFIFEFFFREETPEEREAIARRRAVKSSMRALSGLPQEGAWTVSVTEFFLSFCRYVWGMGLGVALSAMLFMPVISAMRQGTGQYDEIKFLVKMSGDVLSAVRGYVIGTESARGYAALFCGGLAVSAAAALLFSGGYRIRQKLAVLGMGGLCFLMLHWEPAMLAFSLLKKADSYWYRYGFLISFVLLFAAGAWLSRAEMDRWSRILVIPAALLFAAAVLKLNGIHLVDFRAQGMPLVLAHKEVFATAVSVVTAAVLTVILLAGRNRQTGKAAGAGLRLVRGAASILLLALTAAELWGNAWLFWRSNLDDSQTLYHEYSEGLQAQLAQLRAVDGGYYRIAQDRTRWHYEDDLTAYFNDSLAQNYWSNTSYTSSEDDTQLSLMWRLGYRDEAGRMLIVRDPMIASDAFLGVKYLLQSTPVEGLEPVEGVDSFNGRTVYRNPFALPMAFVYDGSRLPTMRYDSTFVYQNQLYSTLSGKKTSLYVPLTWTKQDEGNKSFYSVYVPRKEEGSKYGTVAYGNLLWDFKKTGLMSVNGAEPAGYCRWMSPASFLIRSRQEQAQSGEGGSLQAAIRAERQAEDDAARAAGEVIEESELSLQKKELADAAAAFDQKMVASLDKGAYEDVRTVVFRSDESLTFKDYQFYGLDLNALKEVTDRIRSGEEVTDLKMENGHVTCSVNGVRGRSLCLLVPWSKGWKAYRNGEEVQPDTVAGAMITVPLEDGKNEVELTYQVPYIREGIYVSAAALAVLLIDMLVRWIASRRRRRLR